MAAAGGTNAIVRRVQRRVKAQGSVESREARITPTQVDAAASRQQQHGGDPLYSTVQYRGASSPAGQADRTMARTKCSVRAGQSKRYIAVAHTGEFSPVGG